MRVIEVAAFGGPDVLRVKEVPDVRAEPGQVVVEVAAVSVLSVDAMIRSGNGGEVFPVQPPYVPGAGVAGTVTAVGADVDGSWIGRQVAAHLDNGGYAERVVAETGNVVGIPDGLGLREAAGVLHDGSGAVAIFEAVNVQRGETVLVQPAAGGLGSFLVQLAHNAGATVVAAARGAEKLRLAKELGADITVDYSTPGWADEIRETTGGVDVAFTGVGADIGRAAFELTKRGGRFSNYGVAGGGPTSVAPVEARDRGVTVRGMEQLAEAIPGRMARIERTLGLAAEGSIRPVIGRTFPLEQAAEAHAALANRTVVGKALLIP